MTERGMPGLAGMEARPVKPFVPMSARLLLGAALVDVVVQVFARGLIGGFRDPSPAIVIGVLSYATFFVLAAAVIIGAQGWPAGRPWLLAGAGVFAASGLLNLGFWVWYWAQTGGTNVFADLTDSTAWWLSLRAFAETAAGATAALLVAVGIWVARPLTVDLRPPRGALLLGIGLLGLASVIGYLVLGIRVTSPGSEFGALYYPLLGLDVATMTGIALAAVASLPRIGRLPEVAMGIGALLIVVAKEAMAWLLFGPASEPQLWMAGVLTLLAAVELVGLLSLTGGLAMGRLVAPAGLDAPTDPRR